MTDRPRKPTRPWPLPALLMAALSPAVLAETSPYSIGISQTFAHESNLLHLQDNQSPPAGVSESDTISSTALVAGIDQHFGRQRIFGSGTLRSNRYSDNSNFNSQGYSLALGLDWQTIEKLSGNVSLGADRALRADIRDINGQVIPDRNVESSHSIDTKFSLGVAGPWAIDLGLNQRNLGYSAVQANYAEYRQTGASLGTHYRLGGATTVGLALRRTRVDYPNLLVGLADTDDRRTTDSVDLIATWVPTGASTVNARLSQGKTKYAQFTERDFSATTGSIDWTWLPGGGRLHLTTSLVRDVGQDSTRATTAFSRVTDSLRLTGLYDVTAKIQLNASLWYYRRGIDGNGVLVTGQSGSDNGNVVSLGAKWMPLRSVTVGCSYSRDTRGNNSNALLNEAYSDNAYNCFGQLTLQ